MPFWAVSRAFSSDASRLTQEPELDRQPCISYLLPFQLVVRSSMSLLALPAYVLSFLPSSLLPSSPSAAASNPSEAETLLPNPVHSFKTIFPPDHLADRGLCVVQPEGHEIYYELCVHLHLFGRVRAWTGEAGWRELGRESREPVS